MLVGSVGRRAVLGTPVGIGEWNKRVKRVEILKCRLFDGWVKLDVAFETRIAPRREVNAVVEGTLKVVASITNSFPVLLACVLEMGCEEAVERSQVWASALSEPTKAAGGGGMPLEHGRVQMSEFIVGRDKGINR